MPRQTVKPRFKSNVQETIFNNRKQFNHKAMYTMRTLRIFGLLILMLGGVSAYNKTQAQPGFSITFETFYDELAPYGRWVRNPQYGSVWIPDVPRGFQPYSTAGYWEVTEYGNTWVSDYEWGWAPFHYGRWSFDDYYGWYWIPDYEWGPAWVNWRSGGGYYGWAPLGPGMSINISVNLPSFWWVFVPQRYITSPRWHNYCAPRGRVSHYYNNTVIINNYYRSNNRTYVYGPRRDEIERVTRRSVPVRTIDASPRGRGRVVVAENGRGNDRYNGRGNSSDRGGHVIDANPRIDRSNRNDDNRVERGDDSRRGARNPFEGRNDSRSERNRESAPIENRNERREAPNAGRNDRYEAPGRSERNSDFGNPGNSPERTSRPERNRDYGNPGNSPERANRPERVERPNVERPERVERSNRSFETPAPRVERQERSAPAPEPRSNDRGNRGGDNGGNRGGGDNGGGRGASERSGRGPR